jgi:hypothetical protein
MRKAQEIAGGAQGNGYADGLFRTLAPVKAEWNAEDHE